jgi:hypothetical protein
VIEGQPHIDYSTDYPPAPDMPNAACQFTDPEIFFPVSAKEYAEGERIREVELPYAGKMPRGKAIRALDKAKDICRGCDHLIPCRDFAVINAIPFGVWGATSPRERMMLRRLIYSEVVVEMHVLEVEISFEESSYGEETG